MYGIYTSLSPLHISSHFFRIKDFVEKDIDPQDAEPIYDILQQQEQFQEIVLQYGHLSIVTER